jgi:hypothetical protein
LRAKQWPKCGSRTSPPATTHRWFSSLCSSGADLTTFLGGDVRDLHRHGENDLESKSTNSVTHLTPRTNDIPHAAFGRTPTCGDQQQKSGCAFWSIKSELV